MRRSEDLYFLFPRSVLLYSSHTGTCFRLAALETNLGRMKNEQETLKRKLKITADEKSKIQVCSVHSHVFFY